MPFGRNVACPLAGIADRLHMHHAGNPNRKPQMEKEGHKCTSIEGGMDKQARDKVVKEFRQVVHWLCFD